MPVVTVTAPTPADTELLVRIADAIAEALELGPGDVIATLVPSGGTAVSGGGAPDPWPVVAIHGTDRGSERMRSALSAAERAVAGWAESIGLALGGVWTEWVLPEPAAPTTIGTDQPA